MHVSTQKAHGPSVPLVQERHFDTIAFKGVLIMFAAALNGLAWTFIVTVACAALGRSGSTLPVAVGVSTAALSAIALLAVSAMQRGRALEQD